MYAKTFGPISSIPFFQVLGTTCPGIRGSLSCEVVRILRQDIEARPIYARPSAVADHVELVGEGA
jgi:hypothetical protein